MTPYVRWAMAAATTLLTLSGCWYKADQTDATVAEAGPPPDAGIVRDGRIVGADGAAALLDMNPRVDQVASVEVGDAPAPTIDLARDLARDFPGGAEIVQPPNGPLDGAKDERRVDSPDAPAKGPDLGEDAPAGTTDTDSGTPLGPTCNRCGSACVDLSNDPANCGVCGKACATGEFCLAGTCGIPCAGGTKACGTHCIDIMNDPANCGDCGQSCKPDEVCSGGRCGITCGGGTTRCGNRCVDTASDPLNCRECGRSCAAGEVCFAGDCGLLCGAGTKKCGDRCVETATNPANCGDCSKACSTGEICSGGICALVCGGGTTKCGERCVDTATDPLNCGGCAIACPTGEVCSAGACALMCGGGTQKCGTRCVDTATDPANCGECGKACATGLVCSVEACGLMCAGGTQKCGTRCVDTTTDPANCGGCGTACPPGEVCSGGTCGILCGGGTQKCGTRCVVSALDPANCGECGKTCASGEVCSQGTCVPGCGGGATQCGSLCVNTATDPANCGECGHACVAGEVCSAGACTLICGPGTTKCGTRCVDTTTDPSNCGGCGGGCSYAGGIATCVASVCHLGSCVAGYGDADHVEANGCECQKSNGGGEVCDGIDNDCDGVVDYTINGGQPAATCSCLDRSFSVNAGTPQCGPNGSGCSQPTCTTSDAGRSLGMDYALSSCSGAPWAQCRFDTLDMNAFDADHGASGILEISLCVVGPQAGQKLNGIGLYYGAYPGRKRFSFFTDQELSQGVSAGCYTRHFRPSDAVCQPDPGVPVSCLTGCTAGKWGAPNRPECVFSYDAKPFWVTAEFCQGTAVTASIQNLRVHYLTGAACECSPTLPCRDPSRPVCVAGAGVCTAP